MIVLDASVLIAHLDATDDHHGHATRLLSDTTAIPLGASPLTLAEALTGAVRADRLETARAAIGRLAVQSIALSEDAPVRLAVMRASTGLKLPDCCVLLAVEQVSGELATFDRRLGAVARERGHLVRSR